MIKRILERLEVLHDLVKDNQKLAVSQAIEIVQEVAKEEKEDIDWKSTREYVEERYFKPIMELSEKYDYPCKDIALDFDWVFGLIKKIENCLSNDGGWIPCCERLPDTSNWDASTIGKLFLVSYEPDTVSKLWVGIRYFNKGTNKFGGDEKVIAWQPLPLAYQMGGKA